MIGTQKFVGPLEFMECDACAALPGTPPLCAGCLHNRAVVNALTKAMDSKLHSRRARRDLAETAVAEVATR